MNADLGKGLSFPFRIGNRGQVTMTKADFYDDTHIKESIRQILLTNMGERVMEPEFGSNLRKLVFESNSPSIRTIAINFAVNALKRWEKRINILSAVIIDEPGGKIILKINYRVIANNKTDFVKVDIGKGGESE
jgi:phage baseplate assembly protein W